MTMTSAEKSFSETKTGGAQVVSSEDGSQFYVFRTKEPADMFYF